MPRVTDLGITIGLLPAGRTGSVLDAPGVGLGHATVWRDEPPRPAGRGTARTGVTVLDPGGDLFSMPVPAGAAVLNGAGECTGLLTAQEWGLAETPVFLTSTMQLSRVYPAVTEATEEAVLHSLLESVTVTGRDGNTSYQLPARELATQMRQGLALCRKIFRLHRPRQAQTIRTPGCGIRSCRPCADIFPPNASTTSIRSHRCVGCGRSCARR